MPTPAARLVGDIDLLVEPGRLEETARALAAVGYRRLPDRVAHAHDPLRLLRADRPGLVELHVSPVAFALADALPAADVTARARPARLLAAARIPCPDDLLVHSLAHALLQDHGLRLGELQLRTALDIVRLAGSHSGTIDWDAVAGRLGLVPAGRDAFGFALLASGEALAAPTWLPAPRATSRATRSLAAWRRRNGGPASPATRGRAFLGAYARDWLWRLRHDPDQRRHFAARLLSPRSYPGIARALVAVATDGPPASPRDPCPTHR